MTVICKRLKSRHIAKITTWAKLLWICVSDIHLPTGWQTKSNRRSKAQWRYRDWQ